jgi:thymidylate synthase
MQIRIANPRKRFIYSDARNMNMGFGLAEFLWIITGQNDVEMISFYNSHMANFSDDGKTLSGAYGMRINNWYGLNQIDLARKKLAQDKDSRQAIVNIFDARQDYKPTKDVPCTLTLQFLIRNNRLNMIVNMRSNDCWLGFPYDMHQFSMIQEVMAAWLDVEMGEYIHNAGSYHMYERDFESASNILKSEILVDHDNYYKMNLKDVYYMINLKKLERELRKGFSGTFTKLPKDSYWSPVMSFLFMYSSVKRGEDIITARELLKQNLKKDHPLYPFAKKKLWVEA